MARIDLTQISVNICQDLFRFCTETLQLHAAAHGGASVRQRRDDTEEIVYEDLLCIFKLLSHFSEAADSIVLNFLS